MSDKFSQLINEILIPSNGKSLAEENRILEINHNDDKFEVIYNADGIEVSDKRAIEDKVYAALDGKIDEEKIFVKTISSKKESASAVSTTTGQSSHAQPANLKAGHGPVGANKKRVENVDKVIAVSSGKGGVGKSTVTTNLALSLTALGKKVGVIDADIYGPSLPMLLGKRDAKPESDGGKKILPIEAWGINFISFGLFVDEKEPVIWRGPMLGGVLNQFLFDVNWGKLDYLILDLPPGTGDVQLSMVQATEVDGAIIVSTPQDVALLDSKKGLEMFKKVNVPIIGMVENMSSFICDSCDKEHFIFGKDGVKGAADGLGVNYLGGIPLETTLREASDSGKPYMANPEYSQTKISESFNNVAKNVDSYFNKSNKGGFLKNLFK